jgi:hypothetical protein
MTKIYFCGSIRGGRQLAATYARIIGMLGEFGMVLTEHVGDPSDICKIDLDLTDRQIHNRDMEWIRASDIVVAEVSVPSLGVGYEIGRAVELKKPVLCLFDTSQGNHLSAMISGCEGVEMHAYDDPADLGGILGRFISEHAPGHTS